MKTQEDLEAHCDVVLNVNPTKKYTESEIRAEILSTGEFELSGNRQDEPNSCRQGKEQIKKMKSLPKAGSGSESDIKETDHDTNDQNYKTRVTLNSQATLSTPETLEGKNESATTKAKKRA